MTPLTAPPGPAPLLSGYHRAHAGASIVVCGCGESLTLLDHPERFLTIGVNDVGRMFTPDYLVVVNPRSQFAGDRFRFVETSQARAIFTQLANLGVSHPNVVRVRLGRYAGTDFADPHVLHYTKNSPYVAACLAVQMGASRIGLIGVDFTDHHFFGPTGTHPLSGRLAQIDREYAALAAACAARGVELVNLSPTSRLTALPRATLDEFAGPVTPAPARAPRRRRVFFVNYRFLACGDVFATGLAHAADALGLDHAAAWWDDPRLPEKLRAFAPDLVVVVHGRRAAQRWSAQLRQWRTAVWLLDEPYEVDDTSRWSAAFDTVFVNDPASSHRHRNAHVLPTCFDPQVHRDDGAVRDYQVGFVGGYNPVRERYLARLANEGLLSYVVGGPWKTDGVRRLARGERCTPEETTRLYQRTRLVINVFRSVHHFNRAGVPASSLNPRVFEALACGAMVVSEPRPALTATFPDVPTFETEEQLVTVVRRLLTDRDELAARLAASRARLAGEDYTSRLAHVLDVALAEGPAQAGPSGDHNQRPANAGPDEGHAYEGHDGWRVVGGEVARDAAGAITLSAHGARQSAIATADVVGDVRLSFAVRLDSRCRFIATIHHERSGDWAANSYHVLAAPGQSYLARHHVVLAPLAIARGSWQQVDLTFRGGVLTVSIGGREIARRADATLPSGSCFIGVTGGTAMLRDLSVTALDPAPDASHPVRIDGWSAVGGSITGIDGGVLLTAENEGALLVSERPANDVELEFAVRLDTAHFIAKIHHQAADDQNANSYHLVVTPGQSYLARHDRVLAPVTLSRRGWQRIRLRWIDQRLELYVNGRRQARLGDNLLQSGYCVVGVTAGRAELAGLTMRDLSAAGAAPTRRAQPAVRPGRQPIPFRGMPRRHLMYHVWPARGDTWRWNVDRLLERIDLFNGRRIIGIVHDERSDDPAAVQEAFAGHGCEFVIAPNGPAAEGVTFPAMLERVRSLDPDDVTFYGHAKGVKYDPRIPPPVRQWAEAQYRATLDHWPSVRAHLEQFAATGCFRMLGRFRVHHYLGDWHYSGTFFWLRHAYVFARALGPLQPFYGCVEAWPGIHFRRDETGCLLVDNLRQLPYREEFWTSIGNAAVARWQETHPAPPPPASLVTPEPFDGYAQPRLEQHAEEFAWLLDRLVAAAPRTLLCIGSMHGGVEWHVARRFRALGRDIRITAVDLGGRPELLESIADAGRRFGQVVSAVVGDSTSAAVRAQLADRYDAVFVDGDHTYRGARADLDFALTRSPRLIALHDIVDSDWHAQARCAVSRLWHEAAARHRSESIAVGDWGGIGVLYP